MKKKSLFIGLGLVSCCGVVAIGISTYVSYKNINERVDAVSNSLNAPTLSPSSVLQENYNYYIYLPLNDIKLGDYSSLPTVDTLIPSYNSYRGYDYDIPFYPSLTIENVSFDKINIEVEFLESTYRYIIYLKSSLTNYSLEAICCQIMVDEGYYWYEIGYLPLNSYEYDLSTLDVFDGSHYIRYVRDTENTNYEPLVRSFLGCFSVSSARDMNVFIDYNNQNDFPSQSVYNPFDFYDVSGTGFTYLPFNDFGGNTTTTYGTQKTYVVVPILEGDIFYNGSRYTGLYSVYRTLSDIDGLNVSGTSQSIYSTSGISHILQTAFNNGYYGLYGIIAGCRSLDSYTFVSSFGFVNYIEEGNNYFVYNRNKVNWLNGGIYLNVSCLKYTNPIFTSGGSGGIYSTYDIDSYSKLVKISSYIAYNFNPIIVVSNGGDMPTGTLIINSFTLLSGAFSGLTGLLSFMILPNITIGMIVAIPFLITILLFIIKLFKR